MLAKDWPTVIFNTYLRYRLAHTVIASVVSASFRVADVSAWRMIKRAHGRATNKVLNTALIVAAVLGRCRYEQKDTLVASIGPFWDANKTWIVMAIVNRLPRAHRVLLTQLYASLTIMLLGLILRSVAFDFRGKAGAAKKKCAITVFWRFTDRLQRPGLEAGLLGHRIEWLGN
jgi:hypothetical protein